MFKTYPESSANQYTGGCYVVMDHAFLFQVLYTGDQVNSHSDKGVQIENNPVTFEILLQSRVCRKVVTQ